MTKQFSLLAFFILCLNLGIHSSILRTANGHEVVDLGLSVKWANENVGATPDFVRGYFYLWGETDYKIKERANKDYSKLPKKLDQTNDPATVNYGDCWRTPTKEEWEELLNKCKWEWVSYNDGSACYRITGPNGNKILLPATGLQSYSSVINPNTDGAYLSSTGSSEYAPWILRFSRQALKKNDYKRLLNDPTYKDYVSAYYTNYTYERRDMKIHGVEGSGIVRPVLAKNPSPDKEIIFLKDKADKGDLNSILDLGCCYYNGEGIEKDYEKAFECFKKASSKYILAKEDMATCYLYGNGVKQDRLEAKKYYEQVLNEAANYPSYTISSFINLAWYYLSNYNDDFDYSRANELLDKALKYKSNYKSNAYYMKALTYALGVGTTQDFDTASKYIEQLKGAVVDKYDSCLCVVANAALLYEKRDTVASKNLWNELKTKYPTQLASLIQGLSPVLDRYIIAMLRSEGKYNPLPYHMGKLTYKNENGVGRPSFYTQYKKLADTNNWKGCIALLKPQVAKGNTTAMAYLGKIYCDGNGGNKEQGLALLKKADAAGNALASSYLGLISLNDDKDAEKAGEYFRKSASKGNSVAMCRLSALYFVGKGVEKNVDKALQLAKRATDLGNSFGLWALVCYMTSEGKSEYEGISLISLLQTEAAKTNPSLSSIAAICYIGGNFGTKVDYEMAIETINELISESDLTKFSSTLQLFYYLTDKGFGTPMNHDDALTYLELAAEYGNQAVKLQYGQACLKSKGYEQNGVNILKQCSDEGNVDATMILAEAYDKGIGVVLNTSTAAEYYYKASQTNNPEALYKVGYGLEYGHGFQINKNLAKQYYQKSADLGYAQAKHRLSMISAQEAQEQAELEKRRKRNSFLNQLGLAIFQGIANGFSQAANSSGHSSYSNRNNTSSSYSEAASSSSYSSDDSSNGSSSESSSSKPKKVRYKECTRCHGKGYTTQHKTMGTYGMDKKEVCSRCGEEHYSSNVHIHHDCPTCNGSGKIEVSY